MAGGGGDTPVKPPCQGEAAPLPRVAGSGSVPAATSQTSGKPVSIPPSHPFPLGPAFYPGEGNKDRSGKTHFNTLPPPPTPRVPGGSRDTGVGLISFYLPGERRSVTIPHLTGLLQGEAAA